MVMGNFCIVTANFCNNTPQREMQFRRSFQRTSFSKNQDTKSKMDLLRTNQPITPRLSQELTSLKINPQYLSYRICQNKSVSSHAFKIGAYGKKRKFDAPSPSLGTFYRFHPHTRNTHKHTQKQNTHRLVITVLWYLILETIDFSFLILKDDGYVRSIPYGTIRKPRKGNRKISKRTKWDLRYLEQSLRLECLHWIGVQDWNFLKHLNVSVYS